VGTGASILLTSSQTPTIISKIAIGIPDLALRNGKSAKDVKTMVDKGMKVGTSEARIPQPANSRGI